MLCSKASIPACNQLLAEIVFCSLSLPSSGVACGGNAGLWPRGAWDVGSLRPLAFLLLRSGALVQAQEGEWVGATLWALPASAGPLFYLICMGSGLQATKEVLRRRTRGLASLWVSAVSISVWLFLSRELAAKTIIILSNILSNEEN